MHVHCLGDLRRSWVRKAGCMLYVCGADTDCFDTRLGCQQGFGMVVVWEDRHANLGYKRYTYSTSDMHNYSEKSVHAVVAIFSVTPRFKNRTPLTTPPILIKNIYGGPGKKSPDYRASDPEGTLKH